MKRAAVGARKPPVPPKFEDVYRAHFRFVWRTLAMFSVRDADLMDVTQNVFIVVHRQLPGFEGRARLKTWLFAICRQIARDYRQSAPVRREVVVDFDEFALGSTRSEALLEHVDRRTLSRLLYSTIEKLPEEKREVFLLFALEEMSGQEIASLLEIPLGTVRSRLRVARERLGSDMACIMKIRAETVPLGMLWPESD
jgi:RNA polymerase sigma-70 factor (ECF subfamily)